MLTATWSTTAEGQSIGVVDGPRPATLETTTVGDIPETVAIEVDGAAVTFSLVQGATLQNRGDVLSIQSSDGDAIALIVDDGDSTFAHQTFGAWISGLTFGQGSVGAGSFGTRTGGDRVPVGTTATYTGASSGFAEVDGEVGLSIATVRLVTDFETVVFLTDNTRIVDVVSLAESSAPQLNLSGVLSIDGASFSGPVASAGSAGTAEGAFFGPNAEEAGGLFWTEGPNVRYMGAFGASR